MEIYNTIHYAGGHNGEIFAEGDRHYKKIESAIEAMQVILASSGRVTAEFQPGDGTRYYLFVIAVGDGLIVGMPDHNWCKQVADHSKRPGVTVPDYLRDYGREKRLCLTTASLVAEVLRLAFGDGSESVPFYLFEPETGEPRANIPREVR